jgi:peptidoglycan/LPS O-acetylase OafA/YrhL
MDSPRCPRYATLDAWRGLACLLVVAFHSTNAYVATPEFVSRVFTAGGTPVEWLIAATAFGWVGVPLFFVISGYCIAASADSARRRPHPVGRFFTRRFRRIYPPLWAFLALNTALMLMLPATWRPGPTLWIEHPVPHPAELSWWSWLGQLTLTEEWRHHLIGPPKQYLAGQLWTLCYEEQFYVVTGLIVLLARRWLFAAVAGVSGLVLLMLTDVIRLPFATDGFFFDGLWLGFAAGVAVYYRANYATPVVRRCLDVGFVAGAWWAARGLGGRFEMSVPAFLLIGFGSAAALAWLHHSDDRTAKVRWLAPLTWCGVRCYSLYLVHGPIAMLGSWNLYRLGVTDATGTLVVTLPVCLAVSLATGWAFHRWVEIRFLNSPVRPEPAVDRTPLPVRPVRREPVTVGRE